MWSAAADSGEMNILPVKSPLRVPGRHRGRYGDPVRRRPSAAELEVIELDVEHRSVFRRYEADAAGTTIEIVQYIIYP